LKQYLQKKALTRLRTAGKEAFKTAAPKLRNVRGFGQQNLQKVLESFGYN